MDESRKTCYPHIRSVPDLNFNILCLFFGTQFQSLKKALHRNGLAKAFQCEIMKLVQEENNVQSGVLKNRKKYHFYHELNSNQSPEIELFVEDEETLRMNHRQKTKIEN